MNTLKETLRGIETIVTAKTIKGTTFVGVRGYTNAKGEVSNQTLLVGYNHINLLKKDLEILKALDIKTIIAKYGEEVATKAYSELLVSLAKRLATDEEKEELEKQNDATINRSNGQINAFTTIAKGIKQHNETKALFVTGLAVNKTVLVKGEYKVVKSGAKKLAKDDITRLAGLKQSKIRRFVFKDINEIRLMGVNV